MPKFSNPVKGTATEALLHNLGTQLADAGSLINSPDLTANMISVESLNENVFNSGHAAHNRIAGIIKNVYSNHRKNFNAGLQQVTMESIDGIDPAMAARASDQRPVLSEEPLTQAQIDAGSIAAMAFGNPSSYARAALNPRTRERAGAVINNGITAGGNGSMDYRSDLSPSSEAFDDRTLRSFMPKSVAFNIEAARQDAYCETWYPTIVITPEDGGIDITVQRTVVYDAVQHLSGQVADFKRNNVIDAVVDPTILFEQATRLVPYAKPDDSNSAYFVDPTLVGNRNELISNVAVETRPLVFNKEIDILAESQHTALIGAGVMNHTDAVDTVVKVSDLYLLLDSTATGADRRVIKFHTQNSPRSGFLNPIEGLDRSVTLNFPAHDLAIDGTTVAHDGATIPALAPIALGGYTVRLQTQVSGNGNLQLGNFTLHASPVSVASILDPQRAYVDRNSSAGQTIHALFENAVMIGFDLFANRTNSNRRTRGKIVDVMSYTQRFSVPMGSPIHAPSAIDSNRTAQDVETLVQLVRTRNSNNAITAQMNYIDHVARFKAYPATYTADNVPNIEGMARYAGVRPFYEEINLDLEAQLTNYRDGNRQEDITSLLVNTIRDVAYRMYQDSRYQVALNASMGDKGVKLLIGTDILLQRHLIVPGDTRTFGISFEDFKVVSTFDQRMTGKIIVSLTRNNPSGDVDVLTNGNHIWIPELITSIVPAQRDNTVVNEAMVTPRNTWINHLPLFAVINVSGLSAALRTKRSVNFRNV